MLGGWAGLLAVAFTAGRWATPPATPIAIPACECRCLCPGTAAALEAAPEQPPAQPPLPFLPLSLAACVGLLAGLLLGVGLSALFLLAARGLRAWAAPAPTPPHSLAVEYGLARRR